MDVVSLWNNFSWLSHIKDYIYVKKHIVYGEKLQHENKQENHKMVGILVTMTNIFLIVI